MIKQIFFTVLQNMVLIVDNEINLQSYFFITISLHIHYIMPLAYEFTYKVRIY